MGLPLTSFFNSWGKCEKIFRAVGIWCSFALSNLGGICAKDVAAMQQMIRATAFIVISRLNPALVRSKIFKKAILNSLTSMICLFAKGKALQQR